MTSHILIMWNIIIIFGGLKKIRNTFRTCLRLIGLLLLFLGTFYFIFSKVVFIIVFIGFYGISQNGFLDNFSLYFESSLSKISDFICHINA